ncbi:MAG TPA: gamma-glutamylcyclotransferase family protein [Clostridia bacterium]|nr:gamma-glutamylcyclotransferase family protein [Clostridia bacterium]
MYLHKLFVYGTLLEGMDNYKRFLEPCNPRAYKARARGTMYYLPGDDYPVVLEGGRNKIAGTFYEARDLSIALTQIDEIQKYTGVDSQSYLIRRIKDVEIMDTGEIVKAHMYLWPPMRADWLKKHGIVIANGDWLEFIRKTKGKKNKP